MSAGKSGEIRVSPCMVTVGPLTVTLHWGHARCHHGGGTEWRVYGILCVTSCNGLWIYNILDKQSPVPGLFSWEPERVSLDLSLMGRLWDISIGAVSIQLACWNLVWTYETNEQSQGSYQYDLSPTLICFLTLLLPSDMRECVFLFRSDQF